MDWTGLIVGAIAGIPVGFFANVLFARYQANCLKVEIRRKYEEIVGEYIAYPFPNASEELDFENPNGKCWITHEKENVLKLRYEELSHDHVWEAEIWMETPFTGSMAWRYVRLAGNEPPREHRFGFKRCMVVAKPGRDGKVRKYFYLIGEGTFGKEALERKP